jgi:hypothetical protein
LREPNKTITCHHHYNKKLRKPNRKPRKSKHNKKLLKPDAKQNKQPRELKKAFSFVPRNWARAQSAIGGKCGPKTNNFAGGFFRTAPAHVKFSEKKNCPESDFEKSRSWEFYL